MNPLNSTVEYCISGASMRVCVKPTTVRRKGRRIHRKGYCYTRKDVGRRGRGPKVIPKLKKGALGKYGYDPDYSASSRRKALSKCVQREGYATCLRRVNALRVLFKRTKPSISKRAKSDVSYLQRKYR